VAFLISWIKTKFPWLIQFISFGFIGAFNTLLYLGIYNLGLYLGFNEQLSNFIAFVISVLNAFYWNYKWVFKGSVSSDNKKIQSYSIIKFFALYTTTYFISAILLHVWIYMLNINEHIAPLLSLVITIPINYLVSKFWVFKARS